MLFKTEILFQDHDDAKSFIILNSVIRKLEIANFSNN